jgi:Icc-related predicted phosphoesterase
MIIIALADIHGCLDYLEGICDILKRSDLVLIAGDITNFGGRGRANKILTALRSCNEQVYAIAGNCDLPAVDGFLADEEINLDCNCVELDGIRFCGVSGCSSGCKFFSHKPDEERFARSFELIEKQVSSDRFVLVTHQPAWGTNLDLVGEDRHAGSHAIRDYIERSKPLLAVSAHIHESPGTDMIGNTPIVNPGPFRNGSYAYIELAEKVEKIEVRRC